MLIVEDTTQQEGSTLHDKSDGESVLYEDNDTNKDLTKKRKEVRLTTMERLLVRGFAAPERKKSLRSRATVSRIKEIDQKGHRVGSINTSNTWRAEWCIPQNLNRMAKGAIEKLRPDA